MRLFTSRHHERSAEARRLYARYEIAHTIIDYLAALCFLNGSILSFQPDLAGPSSWFFLFGSLFFLAKPTIRLAREIQFFQIGDVEELAKRAP
ncbi:YrhK family protein [Roseicyclus mahoneyensis]|uniref:YrhK-like protein n=1 Tax=Roseicyclus mahoneyensis TaxID=164332 RepID=A0A316GNC7_9RHOB|nr:YrhK family protein [Roseicyclus mahoneyensis]PWK61470.1 YrhK-like protein [Roseicyclus mahoneyensis]